jgi:hypothetical protein
MKVGGWGRGLMIIYRIRLGVKGKVGGWEQKAVFEKCQHIFAPQLSNIALSPILQKTAAILFEYKQRRH